MGKIHRYTAEQVEFVREAYLMRSCREVAVMFAERFGVSRTTGQIKDLVDRRKFPKSHGAVGPAATQFKRGSTPSHRVPVGTEREWKRTSSPHSQIYVKVAEPRKWRAKARVEWERANGRVVPKGHCVLFGDGNRRNFAPDNLILVTKEQMVVMVGNGLCYEHSDLTKAGAAIAQLKMKKNEFIRYKSKGGRRCLKE
ncbi:MAG: HNH endonuclease [Chitinispirillales bacterium]|nr:HNH endonuclease [Chitinispirillales bacterium]